MNKTDLFLYLLKSMILSGIFFGYYALFLKDTIYHAYNRFYLLAAMALSLIIPFFHLSMFTVSQEQASGAKQVLIYLTQVSLAPVQEEMAWEIVAIGTISALFLTYLAYSVLRIFRLKAVSTKKQMGEFTFIETDVEEAPFSFFNYLFWKKIISIEDENGRKILQHELAHIREKHSWDRLFTQIICSVFWMNPFNWIIQRELIAIHEFIADEEAVGNSNVEAFAKMLLQTHYGNHFFNPTHNFFYSTIKRRLFMLNQTKNTKYSYLRKVMVLPILFSTVCIVSVKVHANEKIKLGVVQTKNNISLLVSDTTKPKTGVKNSQELKPAYFLDGVKISEAEMNSISTSDIESVNVLKGEQAIQKYPEDGKNGVVLIVRKGIKIQPQSKLDNVNSNTNSNPESNKSNVTTVTPVNVENGPVFTVTQKPAMFPGGAEAWSKYLLNNLDRDIPKRNHAVPGKYFVKLNFVINKNGDVENVIAENNPGYGTASEAIRVIEKGPKWIPAEQNGKKVNYFITQSIAFAVAAQ